MSASTARRESRVPGVRGEVSLKRSRRPPGDLGLDSETTMDVMSTADRSEMHAGPRRLVNGVMVPVPMENTYKLDPDARFNSCDVERVAEDVLMERLKDVKYEPATCKALSQELAASIMQRVKNLGLRRYKLVAVVSIGSLKDKPGLQFGSRCLWNQATDSFSSIKYSNGSIFAVAMIYGLYFE